MRDRITVIIPTRNEALHRRLDRSSIRMAHSLSRCALLLVSLYVPMPQRWLHHDWGYWRAARERRLAE